MGCRLYEVGSLIFMALTFYCELDGHQARKRADEHREVTKRELLEQLLWCLGSFVFLLGTFLFDPPIVQRISSTISTRRGRVEDVAAVLFMIGSFMFSLGSYVNGLSIFEAPRMFRRHLITVTTCYQFGGLLFVAGTMGYVDAFEPNKTMRWVATWMYMVGCFFYVVGTGLSFIRTVASAQVSWERKQARSDAKRCRREMSLSNRMGKSPSLEAPHKVLEEDDDLALGSETVAPDADGDAMRAARDQVAARLEEVLGPESGRELAAALWDREGGLLRGEGEDDEDILGAFWRSFLPQASVDEATDAGAPSLRGAAQEQGGAGPPASRLGAETPSTCRDTLPFIESQLDCQGCEP